MTGYVVPSSPVACPVCGRPAGLCCVNGAVRRAGLHCERLAIAKSGASSKTTEVLGK